MKRFLKYCLLFSLPFGLLIVWYVLLDPFKVIWQYEVYYEPGDFVGINRGYVSTMHYVNHKDIYHFDSFVFGNSRSIAFYEEEWRKYLSKSSVCYHFDESGGSVGGIFYKIRYINKNGYLKNALLVVDYQLLSRNEQNGHLSFLPPILKDYQNIFAFHRENFSAFYDLEFLRAFIDYKFSHVYKPYMGNLILKSPEDKRNYNPVNNERLSWWRNEESIKRGEYYDEDYIKIFEGKQFPDSVANVVINEERTEMLKAIKEIFNQQNTNYKIVISPLYNQIKLNPIDLQTLYDVFGKDNVFDFSGVNQWNKDYHNYYEDSHYRPCVANEIMKIVYNNGFQQ